MQYTGSIMVWGLLFCICPLCYAAGEQSPYAPWPEGPRTDADYFPLGVWLQYPADAPRWKNACINLYIGLWEGPTARQLYTLRNAGMQAIVEQNQTAL